MLTNPTNEDRAAWAQQACDTFARVTNMDTAGEDMHTIMCDLLANMMHLASQRGVDFDRVLWIARSHFDAETDGEE